jgi:hypothetical protein
MPSRHYRTGVQLFHFNAAKPITKFIGVIGTSGSIRQIAWDADNHLYALNTSGKMHCWSVHRSGRSEASPCRLALKEQVALGLLFMSPLQPR